MTEDAPCPHCAEPRPPSTVEVLRTGSRAVIRALAGAVLVTGAGPPVRLIANEQVIVACGAMCRSAKPTLVQPGQQLGFVSRRGSTLIPQYAHITSSFASIANGKPQLTAVAWSRTHLSSPASAAVQQVGVTIWSGAAPHRKRALDLRATGFDTRFSVTSGDVTHDDSPGVIVAETVGGSADCRDYTVVATVGARLRTVFTRDNVCETGDLRARGGNLLLSLPVGPCPRTMVSAHCFGGTQTQTLRWDGTRFDVVHTQTKCVLPRLDPARSCRAR